MKKKSMWGIGIVISFVIFGMCILAVVYIAMSSSVDLVSDDYYAKELKYQEHIDALKESDSLRTKIVLSFSSVSVDVHFPKIAASQAIWGAVVFFRPSDKKSDFSTKIVVDSSYTQHISIEHIPKGMWKVQISWNAVEKKYYHEQPIIIQ
ncbi:MAG: FixH family protein [Bacteroidota bacterium]|jgi:hypothetical protein